MRASSRWAAIDFFRAAAAVMVVAIHTSPLKTWTETGDFLLVEVLFRVAVPFFFMTTGYFLARDEWRGTGRLLKRTALLYLAATALYLPLALYRGGLSPLDLLLEGVFYHLWYFPAVLLGVVVAWGLSRLGLRWALPIAAALYLIGLGGDGWYGLAVRVPVLNALYNGIFSVFSYTRNGLFYAPLFLLLGAAGIRLERGVSLFGCAASLAVMAVEGLWLHTAGLQRHTSMYLALPVCMVFLFSLLLSLNQGRNKTARTLSMLVYILHPWCIVLVRGGAKVLHLEGVFIENSGGHFLAVLASSFAAAGVLCLLRPVPLPADARAWKEIDLDALRHNARVLQEALPEGCALMAVLKADAYGHGAVTVARALRRCGVRSFAVATLAEGIALRKAGVRGTVLILGYTAPEYVPLLRRWRLTQTVADASHAWALADRGPVHVHLALDTGMHRLGIPAEDRAVLDRLYRRKNLIVDGVFSHLAASERLTAEAADYTEEQLRRFYETVEWLRVEGRPVGLTHIQSSYGLMNLPPQPCDLVRAGIALYGVYSDPDPVRSPLDLRPVLSLRARVVSIRTLRDGETAGYDLAYRARGEKRLATVSIGYADGLPRDLPRRGGQALLRGRRCPMVGMCMDQLLLDITGLPNAAPGDIVTLIGSDSGAFLPAEEAAQTAGTISNELLSRLGRRLGVVVR